MDLSSQDASGMLDLLRKEIYQNMPTQTPKWFSATVVSVSNDGLVDVHLPTDELNNNIQVQNPRELPLEIGDEVYIVAVDGKLTNAFVDVRKNITLNEIYVDYNTGVDDYKHGTQTAPFKTLQYAVNRLPKNINGRRFFIYYSSLTSTDTLNMDKFYGGGYIYVYPLSGTSITNINYSEIVSCNGVRIEIKYLGFTRANFRAIGIRNSNLICFYYCDISTLSSYNGIEIYDGSKAVISDCKIANRSVGIVVSGVCQVFSSTNTGNNSQYGMRADFNSTIGKYNSQCTGSISDEGITSGSVIR